MVTKDISVFVYGFKIPSEFYNEGILKSQFSKSNILNNIVGYGNDFLLLIIDFADANLALGRLLILRQDVPSILNKKTRREREITLTQDENIKEESHFLIHLKDKLLFGEYNYHAVRHFSHPLMFYLKNKLGGKIDIRPLPNPETLSLLKQDKEIKELEFSIGQERLSHKEQAGVPLLGSLIGLSSNDESCIKISISRGRKKENELDSDKIIEKLEQLKNSRGNDLYSLKVETEKSKYDLLNDNLIFLKMTVNQVNKRTSRADFYRKIKPLYRENISKLKALFRDQ